jgi:hypothetical protein
LSIELTGAQTERLTSKHDFPSAQRVSHPHKRRPTTLSASQPQQQQQTWLLDRCGWLLAGLEPHATPHASQPTQPRSHAAAAGRRPPPQLHYD